jgi:hypothetical protein
MSPISWRTCVIQLPAAAQVEVREAWQAAQVLQAVVGGEAALECDVGQAGDTTQLLKSVVSHIPAHERARNKPAATHKPTG